ASPTISIQPLNYTTCASSNALFYVSATNADAYQWQLFDGTNWNNLSNSATYSGVTNDSLTVNNVTIGFNGNLYRVIASNSCTSVNSNSAELIIDNQPIVATAMLDTIKVCSGTDTILVANYTGQVDSVQWQVDEGSGFIDLVNNANYQNVHNDTLVFQNISQAFDGYIYRALLFNNCGSSAVSEEIILSVFDAPSVSVNPLTNACEGQGVFVSISNLTGSNITYQWQVDTTGVWQNLGDSLGYSNTTGNFLGFSSSITHPSINTDNYRVQITTDCGMAVSNVFRLNVSPAPQISIQPINDSVCIGDNAQFFIQGNNIDSFQWQNNQSGSYANLVDGVKFSGVHNDTLTINNIQSSDLGILYRVRIYGVNHTCTHVTSTTVQIFLSDTVQITQQATDETVCAGNSTSFAINAINANSYQWQVDEGSGFINLTNNTNYAGVNTDSLHLNNIPQTFDGYIFRCVVSNNCGSSNTNQYTLTVNNTQTYNQNVVLCYNDSLVLNNGTVVHNTGVYNDTIANGLCDSIITYNVTALPIVSSTSSEQICANDSFQMNNGTFVYNQGMYVDTFLNATAQNCDSFHYVNLSIIPLVYDTVLQNICSGDTFISPNGNAIWNNGFVTDTFNTAQCDSFVSYNVSLLPISNTTSTINICSNDSLLLQNGTYVNTAGMYIDTFTNATTQGCDSLHYINLTVSNPHFDTLYQNICTGDTFISPNGQELITNGNVTDTINGMVCDSFVTYNISLSPLNFDTIFATICSNENYTLPSGIIVNTTGAYNDTISVATSCDSIITTNLTVLQT
ncbi:MAG: hypothetical protein KDE33_23435, partial [Bacteroidetes bacterium]|nr:hypothetical protein [Bacteroidota bacterium]